MAIHGTTGFCSACNQDAVFSRDFGTPDDTPLCCPAGHDYAEHGGSREQKRNTGIIERHDPYTYPTEKGVWFKGRAGITPEQARMIQTRNQIRAARTKRTKSGSRVVASIPAALFHAHKKMSGWEYWQDPRNVERAKKDWSVSK